MGNKQSTSSPQNDDPATAMSLSEIKTDLVQIIQKHECGPILIRLAWHDAGVYSTSPLSGGCPNAAMRFTDSGEGTFGANAGLPTVALDFLKPVTEKYVPAGVISNADLWALAANVAIEAMGGPAIPTRFGRVDAGSAGESVEGQEGRLPDGDKGVGHLREVFHPKGFDDKDIVALSGAHTVGKCHVDRSGFDGKWTEDHLTFNNGYFKELLHKAKDYEDVTTSAGCPQKAHKATGTMMLISDMALLEEPFKQYVDLYANDQDAFFKDFVAAWVKLQENGTSGLKEEL